MLSMAGAKKEVHPLEAKHLLLVLRLWEAGGEPPRFRLFPVGLTCSSRNREVVEHGELMESRVQLKSAAPEGPECHPGRIVHEKIEI